jgi:cytidine deaminase
VLEPSLSALGLSTAQGPPDRSVDAAQQHQLLLRSWVTDAASTVMERFARGLHHEAAVVVDDQGRRWKGLDVQGPDARSSVCAAPAAVAAALLGGAAGLDHVVVVRHPRATPGPDDAYAVVPPCDRCLDLLVDVAPDLQVVLPGHDALRTQPVESLREG